MGQRGYSVAPKLISVDDKRGWGLGFCKWMDCKLIVSTKLTNVHRQSSSISLFLWFRFATHIPSLFIKKRENASLFLPEFGIQDCWKNGIPNVRGMLRAPVVIGRLSLSCCLEHYKKKDVRSAHPKKKNMCAITCRLGSLQASVIWEKDKNDERSYQMCHIMQISPNDVFQEKYR